MNKNKYSCCRMTYNWVAELVKICIIDVDTAVCDIIFVKCVTGCNNKKCDQQIV